MIELVEMLASEMIETDLSRFGVETRRFRHVKRILHHLTQGGFARSCSTDEQNIARNTNSK